MLSTDLTAEACAAEVMETMPVVLHFIRRRLRSQTDVDLSIPQIRALSYLSRHPGSSLSELADYLGVSNAASSSMIERMVQKKLVIRQDDPQERRCVELSLTEHGRTQYEIVRKLSIDELAKVFNRMPERKMRIIYEGLSLLRDAFVQE